MNILVTGGAGYIGSETVRTLIAKGFTPIVLDNLATGFVDSLKESMGQIQFYLGDAKDYGLVKQIFSRHKIQAVIHLAAKIVIEESIQDPVSYYDNNINSLLNIVRVCHENKVNKIIFSSSGTVYGNANFKANAASLLSETSHVQPISPYGLTKSIGENILQDAKKAYGIDSICLRYFNVAGAALDGKNGQRRLKATHIVHVASKAAVSAESEITIFGSDYQTVDGTCVRDYIHVCDLADIHVDAVKFLMSKSETHILNCGYGLGYSVKQVVETFQQVNKLKLNVKYGPRRLGDPESLICDATKLNNLFGWKPKYNNLDVICSSAYNWQVSLQRNN